jgi:hypothetical protein
VTMLPCGILNKVLVALLFLESLFLPVSVARRMYHEKSSTSLENANHIFNSVHHSMRQLGNTLEHNGMSLAIVTVPEHTEFYHGTSSALRVNDTEWLAFDPEHAMNFAYPHWAGNPWENKSDETSSTITGFTEVGEQVLVLNKEQHEDSDKNITSSSKDDVHDTLSTGFTLTAGIDRLLAHYKAVNRGTVSTMYLSNALLITLAPGQSRQYQGQLDLDSTPLVHLGRVFAHLPYQEGPPPALRRWSIGGVVFFRNTRHTGYHTIERYGTWE